MWFSAGGTRRPFIVTVAALTVLVGLHVGAAPSHRDAEAASRYSKSTRIIRRGLTFTKMVDSFGPNRIKVLEVDPATDLTLDVALANNKLPGRETTSSMADRKGAIAAVNGNFGNDWGRPLGLLAEDARLHASAIAPGAAFAWSQDESAAFVGWPKLDVMARNETSGARWRVRDWNAEYPTGIAGYTKAGGRRVRPPSSGCSVRLAPQGKLRWNAGRIGVGRPYVVDRQVCGERLLPFDGVVLAADRGTDGGRRLAAANRGEAVTLSWSLGWPGVVDAIGGNPVLVREGRVTAEPCGDYVCNRHPRTGIGVTAEGHILLVVVDGRRSESIGLEIVEFARLFRRLGAVSAMNLDGGGSSTMVVKGRVVNTPSDGSERAVVSSVLVLPGPDKSEPRPLAP